MLHLLILIGTFGYYLLGGWNLWDCLYMTVITLTTVGFGEVLPVGDVAFARPFTVGLILVGMGLFLYFISQLTALLIDGSFRNALLERRMLKRLEDLEGHTIVCGLGKTGVHIVDEFVRAKHPCAVLDVDEARVDALLAKYHGRIPAVVGDATVDEDLHRLGITRAKEVVISLGGSMGNVFATLTVRDLNPDLRIIVSSADHTAQKKILHAGADKVVFPSMIGGYRVASEIIRPQVVTFFDLMIRDVEATFRVEQLVVSPQSRVVNKTLALADIRRVGDVLVLATQGENESRPAYNPGPQTSLTAGDTLFVMGEVNEIQAVRDLIEQP